MRDPFIGVLPFVHVAEARSFKAAAERLGVTPAAVSKAVARLEDELGVRLLDRTTRRVEPTAEGARFLADCRAALDRVQLGRDRLAESQALARGELTLSLPHILGRRVVALLPRFAERYPALDIHLRVSDRFTRLVDEHIDVAIRVGSLEDSTAVARKLADTRWVTVASPAYLAGRGRPRKPEELADYNCLVFRSPRGTIVDWQFRAGPGKRAGGIRSISPTGLDIDQGDLLLDATLAGLGVCQMFAYMAREHLAAGRLVELLEPYACAGPPIHALCKPGQQRSAKVRAALDLLVAGFARS